MIQLGLKDTSDEDPVWRFGDGEWYALSRLDIKGDTIFSIGNTITCMHGSNDEAFIEWSRWKFDVFDTETAEEATEKIAALRAKYLALLQCEIPSDLFKISSETKRLLETPQATFAIEHFSYPGGYGWQLTINTKFKEAAHLPPV